MKNKEKEKHHLINYPIIHRQFGLYSNVSLFLLTTSVKQKT